MRPDALPEFADVTVTALDLERAQQMRHVDDNCHVCVVAQAFLRSLDIVEARVGYDAAHVYRRPRPRDPMPVGGAEAAVYKWNDRRIQHVIALFDARQDDRAAALLPLTVHVQRIR